MIWTISTATTWRVGEDGDRDDPWQKTTLIVLVSADAPHDLFTFATTTAGGQSAISDLCEAHAAEHRGLSDNIRL